MITAASPAATPACPADRSLRPRSRSSRVFRTPPDAGMMLVSTLFGPSLTASRSPMIPTPPKPRFEPGTRVRATQFVRVGHREWTTQVVGVVEREGVRPVGGMEMGGKGLYCRQPTIRLRRDDGEVIDVALDEWTRFEVVSRA